ncbi:NAD-dependent epimerase/dehydratase family protein [Candidatus Pelagibacter sp. HIMB1321]|uniref:NAD-dependent epimerase/dehydratase family protein n=1 Tax=Candidatus Pelagibacter sp. HIMB1321 TaxID=1388755 RepID=UPI000A07E7C5|nr:NAD-dependent epimerase/dehydratase family protein [Candidatus Pelagibacter sp. HIMB1321]SMF79978.1 NAD dependent epimerase/dehydratase family protein [Candidatus Pelagibacter sp. HIMB1321]
MLDEKKLLLIGKKSFIANNLYKFLKKKIKVRIFSFEEFILLKSKFINTFTHICNSSIKKEYVKNRYNKKNDIDRLIIDKIQNSKIKYIFFSSRKVYAPRANIRETGKLLAKENYSKNKLITERYIRNNYQSNYLILRISNLIGKHKRYNRKVSYNFIDNYFKYQKNKKTIYYENYFKDFLSIDQFNIIFLKILQKDLKGIFNVSIGEKIFINEILNALGKGKILKKFKQKKIIKDESFYLNNKKLLKNINLKLSKKSLLDYCYKM